MSHVPRVYAFGHGNTSSRTPLIILVLVNLAPLFASEGLPTEAGLCRHQCFSVVAQATAEIRPRPAQGLFFQMKELDRTAEAIAPMNERWRKLCHHLPTWANIAACQLCRERQPLWNSHDS